MLLACPPCFWQLFPALPFPRCARIGSKCVRMLGINDKWQLTLVPAITATGNILPF